MKKCPYCAEDIQDAAIVCKHCGRELGPMPQDLVAEYEYTDFVYDWPSDNKKWTYASPGPSAESSIRLAAWQDEQQAIVAKIEPMINQGWEHIGELGPSGIVIEWENLSDSFNHFFRGMSAREYHEASAGQRVGSLFSCRSLGMAAIVASLIVITAGIAIIPMLFYFGIWRYGAPERFQIRFRRRK